MEKNSDQFTFDSILPPGWFERPVEVTVYVVSARNVCKSGLLQAIEMILHHTFFYAERASHDPNISIFQARGPEYVNENALGIGAQHRWQVRRRNLRTKCFIFALKVGDALLVV